MHTERKVIGAVRKQVALTVLVVGVIQGCVDSEYPDPADKYAGQWSTCRRHSERFVQETLTMTKIAPALLQVVQHEAWFAWPGCAGSPTAQSEQSMIFALTGTKVIGDGIVDKVVNISSDASIHKDVLRVEKYKLRYTADSSKVDADGFPTELDSVSLRRLRP
jgi:hypothetical protein